MDCSYPSIYKTFVDYRQRIGLPPISFEDWMHARDDSGFHQDLASDFIKRSSVPAPPVAACSPR